MAVSVAAARRPRSRSAPAPARLRWDRLGRIAMLCVVAVLLYLYASAGISLLSTWKEAGQDSAQVESLERQHVALEAQHAALTSPGTLTEEARRIGMMRPGEHTYVISGLPSN
jgi:cell division protein FtsB